MSPVEYDVAIVGGGPAGLSAALTLGRAGRRTVLIDAGRHRNASAAHSHGVLSRDGLSPAELRAVARAEAQGYGVEMIDAYVTSVHRDGETFQLTVEGQADISARILIIATGVVDELPDVPGLAEAWGEGVVHCPYCHGHEHRGRPTAVLGRGESTYQMARLLLGWTDDVTVLTNGPEDLDAAMEGDLARAGIRVERTALRRLLTQGRSLAGVEFQNGDVLECAVLYVKPPQRMAATLAKDLGAPFDEEEGRIIADDDGRTDVPGLFVAGDIVNKTQQIVTAMGGGHRTAIAVNHDLVCGPK
jgi:thioredoxin reductase